MDKLPILPIVRPNFYGFYAGDKIQKVLDSGIVTNNGPYVQEFERQLTEYLGAPTLCFSSGMAALTTMLMATIKPGARVACPSFTFAATPHAIRMAGGVAMLYDIDENMCLSPEQVGMGHDLGAVLAVDPYGILADDPALSQECIERGIPLLIDSAAAFGTIGASPRGDAQIFSFHATKPFSTMEGGCLTSRNPEILDKARRIRNFGQDETGDCPHIGFNGKMIEICAIIGLEQLKTWDMVSSHRKVAVNTMAHLIDERTNLQAMHAPGCIWTYLPVRVRRDSSVSRDQVVDELKRRGIMARKYYSPPCHLMTAYKWKKRNPNFPITERLSSQVISLPVYNDMTEQEIDRIVTALREIGG